MAMTATKPKKQKEQFRVAELFAGVGGFRLGLERAGWKVIWSNQWEPGVKKQHASDCYVARFGSEGHHCMDITVAIDDAEAGLRDIPDHEFLVGGFPCQDYSVAKSLSRAVGIEGKKGVLWWQIYRLLTLKKPQYVLLENVDRLLKSPAKQRGRDFAIILSCFASLGYSVEWRVINAAEYGFPQKRRRVFIFAQHESSSKAGRPSRILYEAGFLARAFPVKKTETENLFDTSCISGANSDFLLSSDIIAVSERFGIGMKQSLFRNSGYMLKGMVWTRDLKPEYRGARVNLGDILQEEKEVPDDYYVSRDQLDQWKYLKGAKKEERRHKDSDTVYFYTEGALPFPDPTDRPARTILTGEGGSTPSRFKHIIGLPDGRYRRLTPVELERLNGFDDGWTDTGMPRSRRAFCMGNALVVGVVERVGKIIHEEISSLDRYNAEDINEEPTEEGLLTATSRSAP